MFETIINSYKYSHETTQGDQQQLQFVVNSFFQETLALNTSQNRVIPNLLK